MPRYTGTRYSVINGSPKFLPSDLSNLVQWNRFNVGITVTGSGVSQWDDQSSNGAPITQGTDAARPALQGDGSILFDGVDDYLSAIFTLNRPQSIYVLLKQVTWTSADTFYDGNVVNFRMCAGQINATPTIRFFDNSTQIGTTADLSLDTYGVIFNSVEGTSGVGQVNNNTPITGTTGGFNMGGLHLGCAGGPQLFSNIQVKEIILYAAAHDAETRTKVINYLNSL